MSEGSDPASSDATEDEGQERRPDLLIDLAAFDDDNLSEMFANPDEQFTQQALLSAERIAALVHRVVELNDHFSLIHLLTAILVEPNPKRARAVLAETLRCLYIATRARPPRHKTEAAG
jgi:hypothetical protein